MLYTHTLSLYSITATALRLSRQQDTRSYTTSPRGHLLCSYSMFAQYCTVLAQAQHR